MKEAQAEIDTFNRTIVELKFRTISAPHPPRGPFNRTIVELKYMCTGELFKLSPNF